MSAHTVTVDHVGTDFEIEIGYSPAQAQTLTDPGFDEEFEVCAIKVRGECIARFLSSSDSAAIERMAISALRDTWKGDGDDREDSDYFELAQDVCYPTRRAA